MTFYGYSWGSTDTGVATVVDGDTNLVGVGSATGSALIDVETTRVLCPIRTYQPAGAIKALTATITVHFTGSKTVGDNLTFPMSQTCSQNLGLLNCISTSSWRWNIEVQATVSDDASYWTARQSYTGRAKGYYKDSNGNLQPFDDSLNVPNDDPESAYLQQPSGQQTIFWIDGPGHEYMRSGYAIDSMTQVQNFTSKVCSTLNSSTCFSVQWYVKLVINPGAVLDTTSSTTGFGSLSTNF